MQRVHRFLDWTHRFKGKWWIQLPLIGIALYSIHWGYTDFYGHQLNRTAWYLRPFVADSPNAVALYALVLALYAFGKRHSLLDLFAWTANLKIGLWACIVFLYDLDGFVGPDSFLRWLLFAAHIGMCGQSLLLHHDLRLDRPKLWHFGLLALWLGISDYVDYSPAVDIHPVLPGDIAARPVVAAITIAISIGLIALAWAWYRPKSAGT